MIDNEEPILDKDETDQPLLIKLKRWQWWLLIGLNTLFILAGQCSGVILCRFYYDEGGNSKWLATLVQTAGFPVLYIPLFFLPSPKESSSSSTNSSVTTISLIYFILGAVLAGDSMLYSVGLQYLSASTYSLICATQLAFSAVFSFLINSQKFTALILNSVVVLTLSAAFIAFSGDPEGPSGVSSLSYVVGFLYTLTASAVYSLFLCLMQFSFQNVIKKESFSVVLEMQIYTSAVATCVSMVGLFASGEWRSLQGEMAAFSTGTVSYLMTQVGTAVAWQACAVGIVGLIFVVSSLFANVIGTVSLAITPIVSVIVFHDKMNGVKIIAMLLALWGFSTYIYQNYLDDLRARRSRGGVSEPHSDSSSSLL